VTIVGGGAGFRALPEPDRWLHRAQDHGWRGHVRQRRHRELGAGL